MTSLGQKTVKGLFWSFLNSFGVYFIKFAFSIAIARALSPSDYGIIGMIVIFIGIGQMLAESGFTMALIQKKDADAIDFSTVFWFNLVVSILVFTLLFFTADAISNFYEKPILVNITRIAGLGIIIGSFSAVQMTLLTKEMEFKKQTIINFVAAAFSGTTGVILAYKGFAVWALVLQTLAGSFISTCGYWLISKWRPEFIFSYKSIKTLYHFGYKIFLQGVAGVLFSKIYYPLIGKYYSTAQLGFYSNANRFYDIFVIQPAIAYGRVTFPALSSISDHKNRLSHNYLKIYRLLAFGMFPATLIAIKSARPFVILFLTEKWLPVVPLMTVFFLEGFYFSLFMLNQNTLNAIGKSDVSLKVDIIKKLLAFSSIFIVFRFGINALIVGQVASSFLAYLLSTYIIKKELSVRISEQLKEIIPIMFLTLICGIINEFFIAIINIPYSVLLPIQIIFIVICYILLSFLVRSRPLKEVLFIFYNYLPVNLINNIEKWYSY